MSTRRPLTLAELTGVLAPVGRPVAERPLSGGLFASVQAVELADGRSVVVKTGQPDDATGLLSHERTLLRAEVALLRLAEPLAGVPAPRVLHTDLSRAQVEVDVAVVELLPGESWDASHGVMTPAAGQLAGREVGGVLARLNAVHGPRFGYPTAGSGLGGATWPAAFTAMTEALLADADRWAVRVDAPRVRAAVAASDAELAEVVAPHLVHMDLWPGNVLLDPATGAVRGVVDFERGLFGDPLMDFVGHDPFRTAGLPPDPCAGYLAAGGTLPLARRDAEGDDDALTPAARRRLALYRLYLTLIMTIEVVPRGYDWPDLGGYVDRLVAQRAALLDALGA